MKRQIVQLLSAALIAGGTAMPAGAATNEEIAKGIVGKAVFGAAVTALAIAAPGAFVALMAVGTVGIVKTVTMGFKHAPHTRPAGIKPSYAYEQASAVFPASTGVHGAAVPYPERVALPGGGE